EVLRFCRTGRPKSLHYVSSTIVFGWTVLERLYETDSNPNMANLDFGYAQTKWTAEQLVLQARNHGLTTTIFRPSFLTASTTGLGCCSRQTDPIYPLFGVVVRSYGKLMAMERRRYGSTSYREARAAALPDHREPSLATTVDSLVTFLVDAGLANPPLPAPTS